ncbi:MAG: AI-2E family transporter [Panacagrimonas sp.]
MAGTSRSAATHPASTPARSAIRVVNYVTLLAALVMLLLFAKLIVVAVVVGIGIGVILVPGLHTMHRRLRIPRGLAAALVAIFGIALLGLVTWSIFAMVDSQLALLAERAPELIKRLQGQLQGLLSRYPWLKQNVASMDLAGSARGLGTAVFKGAWSGIGVISALAFAAVIGLYVAVEAREYHEGVVRAFPASRRPTVDRLMCEAAKTVRSWFRAQLLDMLIVGSLTSIGLWMVGADYWLLFGLLTGLLGIVPYVGIAIVVVFAGLITLASDPGRLPWVLGVFLATQQLEGNVILPLVMRGSVRLPAAPLLVFMLLMGAWAGLLGVLIAPPLFAILCLGWRELYLPHMDATSLPSPTALGQLAAKPIADPAGEASDRV